MPKQNNELAQRGEPVHAELILSPAMQSQTLLDKATIEKLVERQVDEMLAKSETAVFEPFFCNRQVKYALRRLQSIPEQRVHALRYERFGCMVCKRDDKPHGGLGMCGTCYNREFQLRKKILLENSSRSTMRDVGFKAFAGVSINNKKRHNWRPFPFFRLRQIAMLSALALIVPGIQSPEADRFR